MRRETFGTVAVVWIGGGTVEQSLAAIATFGLAVRRNVFVLVIWMGCCAGLAAAYVGLTTPEYIASVQLVLENGRQPLDGPDAAPRVEQIALNGQQVETQIGLIKSDNVLRYVFRALTGPDAPDAFLQSHGAVGRDDAFRAFKARVSARRVALSDVVEIAYRASDARWAARVANSIAAAYIRDRVGSAVEDAQVGTPYLKSRIDAILTEAMLAAGDVRVGMVPGKYLPDADARILGPAIAPMAPTYPKLGPVLVFAIGFGGISGLVAIAILQQAGGTIRSRQHFRSRFILDCIDVTLDEGAILANSRLHDVAKTFGRASAADLNVTPLLAGVRRYPAVGVVSWSGDPACKTIAAALTSRLTAAGPPAVLIDLDPDGTVLGPDGSERSDLTRLSADLRSGSLVRPTVIALPPLDRAFIAHALAPLLDAAVLVIAANRTTVADVEAALRSFQTVGASFAVVVLTCEPPQRHGRRRVGELIGRAFGRASIIGVHRDAV